MERLSPKEFEREIHAAQFRWDRLEDIVAEMALYVMAAAGNGKKEDGEFITRAELLGREPVSLIPPRQLTPEEEEAREWEEMQREAKAARARMFLYEVEVKRRQAQGLPGPTIEG